MTTQLDAGIGLRHARIAARYADPPTSLRYDRAKKSLDRHRGYIPAVDMASGTQRRRAHSSPPMRT